jgi:hypothetical protein
MDKNNAKISILSELLSFPTIRGKDWISTSFQRDMVRVGDLVSMSSAPPSKWYLSWVRDYKSNNGWPKYLLESIEDGSLCWWENIRMDIYDRERVKENPQWRWNDRQFAFASRWYRVCKRIDGWKVRACQPKFNDDGSVELNARIHILFQSKFANQKTFPNWKKVTIAEMEKYYKECISLYEAEEIRGRSEDEKASNERSKSQGN